MQHTVELVSRRYRSLSTTWVRPGELGVVLFFLCSGFIIPASLERHGSVARFWVGRAFRLFPLYWAATAGAVVLAVAFNRYPLPGAPDRRLHLVLTNATMVQDLLRAPLVIGASWSLAYEMAFYVLVTALFLAGAHRRSAGLATVGLVATLALAAWHFDALDALGSQGALRWAIAVGVAVLAAVVMVAVGRSSPRRSLSALGLCVVVALLVANRPEPLWFAVLLFATMFVGTVMYRAVDGSLPWRRAWILFGAGAATAAVAWVLAIVRYAEPTTGARISWAGEGATFAIAFGLFALGLHHRNRSFPAPVRELGRISYSLYLCHPLVIYGIGRVGDSQVLTVAVWVTVSVVAAMITYRVVEKPFIELGRRASARWPRRQEPIPDVSPAAKTATASPSAGR